MSSENDSRKSPNVFKNYLALFALLLMISMIAGFTWESLHGGNSYYGAVMAYGTAAGSSLVVGVLALAGVPRSFTNRSTAFFCSTFSFLWFATLWVFVSFW